MERFKTITDQIGNVTVSILEFTSVLCIILGLITVIYLTLRIRQLHVSPMYNRMRLKFGGWIALALEFQLAADIVETTLSGTYEHLIQLGALAVIRTFLNYFLSRELKEELEAENKRKEALKSPGEAQA
jgi:uncharacterized membrane protein